MDCTNPKIALEWIDNVHGVLTYIGCPFDLWVHMASGAMLSRGKLWWESAHTAFLVGRVLEQIG